MIDVNKTPTHDWERELQEIQHAHDKKVIAINRGYRIKMILLFAVVAIIVALTLCGL